MEIYEEYICYDGDIPISDKFKNMTAEEKRIDFLKRFGKIIPEYEKKFGKIIPDITKEEYEKYVNPKNSDK